jgi:lysophospholipase L1-like esterase
VPAETALVRQVGYVSEAVNGAEMLRGSDAIAEQGSTDERYSVVVVDGGANDLNRQCGCGPCTDTLDALLTEPAGPDAAFTGAFVEVTERWRATGAQVLLLGYHPVKDGAWYGFADCFDTITELDRRVAAYAAATEGVGFYDVGDVIRPQVKGVYAIDGVHFSPKAAELLAGPLAEQIEALREP